MKTVLWVWLRMVWGLACLDATACGGSAFTSDFGDGGAGAGGGGGGPEALACGTASCMATNQTCCVTRQSTSSFTYACVDGSTCARQGDIALHCSATADCPMGQVCCIGQDPVTDQFASVCSNSCTMQQRQLCDPSAADTGCPAGQTCGTGGANDLGLPASYGICRVNGG